jgi:two-component system sensor histidine kinase ChvG
MRFIESFAGDVSHEFKNPLASVRVAGETMAGSDDPAERHRIAAMLTRDVDRLERLVSGVRELARIDAQLAHEALAPVDVAALVTDVINGYRQRAGDVAFNVTVPAAPVLVRASADRLAQVAENLLDNAASFAPRGSAIDVRVAVAEGSAVITVEDRGPGFPPGHAARAFERFFSYRPDSTEPREHMGLGLSIARAIAEGYGGSAQAANRSGGGATVEVRLPTVTLA